jgi:eukaryotic-like serine/threonine-protein kinase
VIGDRLGQFRIVGRLGAGGMGEVYRARDEQLDRDVAIKLLVSDLGDDSRGRLLREARAAGGLNHPSICTIYMVGEADGVAFIAMELVDGPSLSAALSHGPLPIDQVLQLGGEISEALAHAHGPRRPSRSEERERDADCRGPCKGARLRPREKNR